MKPLMPATPIDERFAPISEKFVQAYAHKENGELPAVVMDVKYTLFGEDPAKIPEDYFSSPAVQFERQMERIGWHLARIDDDYIPLLFPWFGTGVVPSALGCPVVFPPNLDPALNGAIVTCPEDIRRLCKPDPHRDGLMPRVLECIQFMRRHSALPVSATDCQGPLNIALSLCGPERLFLWFYTAPAAVHELMEFATEVLIEWVKVQKVAAGQPMEGGAWAHGTLLPPGYGGVYISDDDCAVVSAEHYREFVVPYNSRVFKAFGGGALHFCGTAGHQLENFLATEGLTAVNNFCMGNFRQVWRMQELFENRLALMVCDFAPLDIEDYYAGLFSNLRLKGTVLAVQPVAAAALHEGKYVPVRRDAEKLSKELERVIHRHLRKCMVPVDCHLDRFPSNGHPCLPVEIVLAPDWWHAHAGISFDQDFFFHPARRVEAERRMEQVLYDRWGHWGLGRERARDVPLVGATHLAAGFLLSEMLGCRVAYQEAAPPQVHPAGVDDLSLDEAAVFASPAFKRFESLVETLERRHGRLAGDVNWSGVLNLALDLRGQQILLDLALEPERTGRTFQFLARVIERFVDYVESRTASSSISVNRMVGHFSRPVFLHSECSHTMISEADYERFLLPLDVAWSQRHRPFGIHYCGPDPHRHGAAFAKIPRLDFLDVGWGGDLKALRRHLPDTFLNIRLSPVEIVHWTPDEIGRQIRRLVADAGDPRLTGVCCINMDRHVRDEQVAAIFETVEELRQETRV